VFDAGELRTCSEDGADARRDQRRSKAASEANGNPANNAGGTEAWWCQEGAGKRVSFCRGWSRNAGEACCACACAYVPHFHPLAVAAILLRLFNLRLNLNAAGTRRRTAEGLGVFGARC